MSPTSPRDKNAPRDVEQAAIIAGLSLQSPTSPPFQKTKKLLKKFSSKPMAVR